MSDYLKTVFGNLPKPTIPTIPTITQAVPEKILFPEIPRDQNLADAFQHRIMCWVNDFHRNLDDEHEVGGQLASFGSSITFHFTDINYWNPSLISFVGVTENGEPVELIQHVTQINVLLIKQKRENLTEPKRPIGFASWDEYDSYKESD